MIRLSVLYPSTEGATFDHDYYRDKHVPLAVKTWGLDGAEIDKGVNGPYVAAVHFKFESMDAMGAAMGAEGTGRRDGRRRQLHDDRAGACRPARSWTCDKAIQTHARGRSRSAPDAVRIRVVVALHLAPEIAHVVLVLDRAVADRVREFRGARPPMTQDRDRGAP